LQSASELDCWKPTNGVRHYERWFGNDEENCTMTTEQAYWLGFIVGGLSGAVGTLISLIYVAMKADRKLQQEAHQRAYDWDNS